MDRKYQKINDYFAGSAAVIRQLAREDKQVSKAAEICCECLQKSGKIIFCGNGGSAAEAQHLSAELMGRFLIDRNPLASLSLTVDTSAISAIGNDYGFENVFSRQLAGVGNSGDVLIGLTTSGNSLNIARAFELAKQKNITCILFTGDNIGSIDKFSDLIIRSPSKETNFIQEGHLVFGHLLCKLIEDHFYANT